MEGCEERQGKEGVHGDGGRVEGEGGRGMVKENETSGEMRKSKLRMQVESVGSGCKEGRG